MTLKTMPIDASVLEFRYHGATEYKAYNRETEKRDKAQAVDEATGDPIYTIRCQVLFRDERESGLITVRVPLKNPPPKDDEVEFEAVVAFTSIRSKSWSMDGRDGQTWTATSMEFVNAALPARTAKADPAAKEG